MSADIERVNTGIPGLDELIQGGLVKNSATLITGTTGTGKTIFCSQFIQEGLKNGENCMFITFEENPEKIKEAARDFGWDFDKHHDEGSLIIKHKDPFEATNTEELFWFEDELEKHDVDRVAMDSTSVISLYHENGYDIRRNLFKFVEILEGAGVTSVLTTEAPEGEDKLTRFGVEQFLVDGVIKLNSKSMGEEMQRTLEIRKMRRTNMEGGIHSMEITKSGIEVEA